jgi:hypothetical protein
LENIPKMFSKGISRGDRAPLSSRGAKDPPLESDFKDALLLDCKGKVLKFIFAITVVLGFWGSNKGEFLFNKSSVRSGLVSNLPFKGKDVILVDPKKGKKLIAACMSPDVAVRHVPVLRDNVPCCCVAISVGDFVIF